MINQPSAEYRAELERLVAVVREQNPNLETWILGYIGSRAGTLPVRYTYESWYQPADRPHVWRGKRGPAEK